MSGVLDAWESVLPGGVKSGLLAAIASLTAEHRMLVEDGVTDQECAGILFWRPMFWDERIGAWEVRLEFMHLVGAGAGMSGGYQIPGGEHASAILHAISNEVEASASRMNREEFLGAGPQWVFGTVHTHPSGSTEISPQDLLAEKDFELWRSASGVVFGDGGFALGKPSSFVLAMGDGEQVNSLDGSAARSVGAEVIGVTRYDSGGRMVSWSKTD